MATRDEVARLAGVSPSTVSYAFSDERPIKPETRERVLAAAKKLAYVPNAAAAKLAAHKTHTIGIDVNIERSGMDRTTGEYVTGMIDRSRELGLTLLVPTTVRNDEESFRRFIRSRLLDGVIYMEVENEDWREPILLEERFPAVALGFSGRQGGVPYVESDFEAVGRLAVDECVSRGHRQALFVGRVPGSRRHLRRVGGDTLNSMRSRGAEKRLRIDELLLAENFLAAKQVIPILLRKEGAPSVIIIDNMPVAEGIIALADEHGMRVGRDYSMVTLSGQIGYTVETAFDLSEVATDRLAMGAKCVDLLVDVCRSRDTSESPENVLFTPEFVDRGSLISK